MLSVGGTIIGSVGLILFVNGLLAKRWRWWGTWVGLSLLLIVIFIWQGGIQGLAW